MLLDLSLLMFYAKVAKRWNVDSFIWLGFDVENAWILKAELLL